MSLTMNLSCTHGISQICMRRSAVISCRNITTGSNGGMTETNCSRYRNPASMRIASPVALISIFHVISLTAVAFRKDGSVVEEGILLEDIHSPLWNPKYG